MRQLTQEECIIATITQDTRIHCPKCSADRRHHDKTLSVTVESDCNLYKCHHCDWQGKVPTSAPTPQYAPPKKITPIPTQLNADTQSAIDIKKFFADRGVTLADLSALPPMTTGRKYFNGAGEQPAIGFVYGPKNQPTAIKWRTLEGKAFTQENAAREFYGLDQLPENSDTIIIVEGEPDVIALASIGIPAISVPNGAPMKVSRGRISAEEDRKFSYVWESRELLDAAKKVILAVDGDEAGGALAEEIARRVGRASCWRVTYPEGCKDVTDVLRAHGKAAVTDLFKNAEPMPLVGVYTAKDYIGELFDVYRNGTGKGESTGFHVVDEMFTVAGGQVTVVTGLPGSGKSTFVDAIMVNLAMAKDWKFAIASFENPPATHIACLCEKIIKKPFFPGVTPRMGSKELEQAVEFVNDHFAFLESKDGSLLSIDNILSRAKESVKRLGCRGLVIDPYSYISHDGDAAEHQHINTMLTKVSAFAKAHDVHVWFVAHPAKMYPREDGSFAIPKGMAVSGSAAWFNHADVGITVHRGNEGTEIHCWKVRFKWIGKLGMCYLSYDAPTSRYFEDAPKRVVDAKGRGPVSEHTNLSGKKEVMPF